MDKELDGLKISELLQHHAELLDWVKLHIPPDDTATLAMLDTAKGAVRVRATQVKASEAKVDGGGAVAAEASVDRG